MACWVSNSAGICWSKLQRRSATSRRGGSRVHGMERMTEMPDRRVLADDGKNLEITIIALDGLLSDRGQRDTVPDMFGDNGIHQDLPVVRQAAKP